MADSSINVTQPLHSSEKFVKLKDNSDDTYSVSVSFPSAQAISGTVTANLGVTDNAVLDDIASNQTDGSQVVTLGATDNAVLDDAVLQLKAISPISSVVYDTVLITYSDATKTVISKVEWKLNSVVVKTLTPTFAALTDTWVRS